MCRTVSNNGKVRKNMGVRCNNTSEPNFLFLKKCKKLCQQSVDEMNQMKQHKASKYPHNKIQRKNKVPCLNHHHVCDKALFFEVGDTVENELSQLSPS